MTLKIKLPEPIDKPPEIGASSMDAAIPAKIKPPAPKLLDDSVLLSSGRESININRGRPVMLEMAFRLASAMNTGDELAAPKAKAEE